MKFTRDSVPDQVSCHLVRGGQCLLLRVENNSRDHASQAVIDNDLIDSDPSAPHDQADRVVAPVVHEPLFHVPSNFALIHLCRLHFDSRPIVQIPAPLSKPAAFTLGSVTPPQNLRTQLPKEADHA